MTVLETDRLRLRLLTPADAEFILELVNTPAWLRYIGDRNIRSPGAAQRYILEGPVASYTRHGYGLYLVERQNDGLALGICGLVSRDILSDADIGFAFLPRHGGQGYALEAAAGVMRHARHTLRLQRVLALTTPDNANSIKLLQKLGLHFTERIRLPNTKEDMLLFSSERPAGEGGDGGVERALLI